MAESTRRDEDDLGTQPTLGATPVSAAAIPATRAPAAPDAAHDRTLASGSAAESPAGPVSVRGTGDPAGFALAGEVARGGMGRVVAARDLRLERRVAVKQLLTNNADLAARFRREALLTARLQHPGIVPIYEAGALPSGEPFYAMRLVDGRSLEVVITETKMLEERIALLPNVITVCDAMAYAHSERVIHRDLKPANILVGAFGETVVIDWGLAKDLRDEGAEDVPGGPYREAATPGATVVGSIMGTPAYMPPEQAAGERADERSDVFSLGAVLYHLLSGAPPYKRGSASELLSDVLARPPMPLAEKVPGLAAELGTIVGKAMARRSEERYPTARELAADLRRFQTGQLVSAHRYSMGALVLRWVRRHRAVLAVALLALAIIGAGGAISVRRIIAERDQARVARHFAEQERGRAEAASAEAALRADTVIVSRARAAGATDPTAALAWLKRLTPESRGWSGARTIAAAAAARGIAFVGPRSPDLIFSLAFTPDAAHVIASGNGHGALDYDVAAGTATTMAASMTSVDTVIAPDGKVVALLAPDSVEVWDRAANRRVTSLDGFALAIAFASDSQSVAAVTRDAVIASELAGGTRRFPFAGHDFDEVAFTRDGRTLVVVAVKRGTWTRIDRASGAATERQLPARRVGSYPQLAPNGARIAWRDANGVVVLDTETGATSRLETAMPETVVTVVFSPDGSAIGALDGAHAVSWDLASGTRYRTTVATTSTMKLHLSDNGTVFLVQADRALLALHARGQMSLVGDAGDLHAAALSADGRWVAAIGDDRTLRVWPVGGARAHRNRVCKLSGKGDLSSDGAFASTTLGRTAEICDTATGAVRTLQTYGEPIENLVWAPRGAFFAVDDGAAIWIWSAATHVGRAFLIPMADLLAVSPQGDRVAFERLGVVGTVDTHTGRTSMVCPYRLGAIQALEASPDARTVASTTEGTVSLCDLETGAIRVLATLPIYLESLAWSPDGRRLAVRGAQTSTWILDVDGAPAFELPYANPDSLGLAFSPDGRLLALGMMHTVTVWDLTRRVSRTMRGLPVAYNVRFSADSTRLLMAGDSPAVTVFDVETGEARTISVSESVRDATFAADGTAIVGVAESGQVYSWLDDLPMDATGLRAWIERATNATIDADDALVPTPAPAVAAGE